MSYMIHTRIDTSAPMNTLDYHSYIIAEGTAEVEVTW